ncbi:alpha/beta fold hydrolase [Demequina sp. SO4-18]|uniref:alpha/beta fold hydrolase n=1 Tax=Demequina sp. SO4-18 TaxID=3401026 RepID=UPI003B59CA7F
MSSTGSEQRYREAEAAMWAHHGMEPTERWVEAEDLGIRVHANEHGQGRPSIFIHGTPTAGGVFVPLVGQLTGVRAVVVDRPGCALSEPLDYRGMSPDRAREVIEIWMSRLVEAVSDEPVDLVASSAGGFVALVLAAHRPELVRSVALLGAPAVEGMNLPVWMRMATFAPVANAVARHDVNKGDLRRSFKSMGHGDLVAKGGISQADLEWRYALSRDTDTYAHDMQMMRQAATWRGPRPGWVATTDEIESLTVPSLWVAGDNDPFATPDRIREWASHAPDATFTVMEGSGHQPWIDRPAAHARVLEDWWASIGRMQEAEGGGH